MAKLTQLERPDLVGVRWVAPAQWHVTLRFFGEVDGADVSGLIERLSAVAAQFREGPPIRVSLGPRVGRLGARILAVEVDGLGDLADQIRLATSPLGERGRLAELGPRGPGSGGGADTLSDPAEVDQSVAAVQGGAVAGDRSFPVPSGAGPIDPDAQRPFLGHLTLARCRPGAKVADVVGQPVSATWAVQDLALIAAELGPGGSRYHDVIRLPLSPQLTGA